MKVYEKLQKINYDYQTKDKEIMELKKKYEVMRENAYILQERIDKAIEYVTDYSKSLDERIIVDILKGSDK